MTKRQIFWNAIKIYKRCNCERNANIGYFRLPPYVVLVKFKYGSTKFSTFDMTKGGIRVEFRTAIGRAVVLRCIIII